MEGCRSWPSLVIAIALLQLAAAGRPPSSPCVGRPRGRYAIPGSCASFLACFDAPGLSEVVRCPLCEPRDSPACAGQPRLAFAASTGRCVWPIQLCSPRCRAGCAAFRQPSRYLLVWAGPDDRQACKDTLFTIDVTPSSPAFGSIVGMAEAPTGGNEPHHVGLSPDGQVLAAGGLLAVLKGQPDILYFNVSDPRKAKFLSSADPPQSAVADEFVATPDGGFLVSMMGSASGGAPGRIARLNANRQVVAEYPAQPPANFNPHGFAVDWKRKRMVSTDYLLPASTLLPTSGPVFRTTLRVWNTSDWTILRTFDAGPQFAAGFMDARVLGDRGVAVASSGAGIIFGVDLANPARIQPVHFVGKNTQHCLMQPLAGGRRLVVGVFGLNLLQLLDAADPWRLRVIQEVYLPAGTTGPHYLALSDDERQLAVSTYFLDQEPSVGVVHLPGSREVLLYDVLDNGNRLLPAAQAPSVDFKSAPAEAMGKGGAGYRCGAWRPHGMAFKITP